MDRQKDEPKLPQPLTGCAALSEAGFDRKSNAVSMSTTLCLGLMRRHFPHLVLPPFPPPSIGERRKLLFLLLNMLGDEQMNLAGRDDAIDRATRRARF